MFVGIDVANEELVVAVRPSGEVWTVASTPDGVRGLVMRWRAVGHTDNRPRISAECRA